MDRGAKSTRRLGWSVLEIAHRNDIDIGALAKARRLLDLSCHRRPGMVRIAADATEDEEDMLDLGLRPDRNVAARLSKSSSPRSLRADCALPTATRNMLLR